MAVAAIATKIEFLGPNRDGEPRRFSVASNVLIPKGTLLKIAGARTAVKQSAVGDYLAGVALSEKSATDHSDTISAITQGIMTFVASGSIAAGVPVKASDEENAVEAAANTIIGSAVLGYAISDATGNVVQVRINL